MAIPRLVADINPGSASSSPRNLTAVGDTLFFSANDGNLFGSGRELWALDLEPAQALASLALTPRSADRPEVFRGNTPFTFTGLHGGYLTCQLRPLGGERTRCQPRRCGPLRPWCAPLRHRALPGW
jgi:hypothetical protein